MKDVQFSRSELLLAVCATIYIAVLPMASTIALRNLALLGMLMLLVICLRRTGIGVLSTLFGPWLAPLVVWIAYLCLFPLFAEDSSEAWRSLGTVWYRGILALLAGAGLALVIGPRLPIGTAFQIGVVSMTALFIHLGLVVWKAVETSAMPWNYWGRETHHADLGYAAGHAVVLLAISLVAGREGKRALAWGLIAVALASVTIAHSRGGLGFALLGLLLVFALAGLARGGAHRFRQAGVLVGVISIIAGMVFFASRSDDRWGRMIDRLAGGFYGDSLQIQCEGYSKVEQELIQRFGEGHRAADLVESIRNGDGARMVLLRAGLRQAIDHPWGLDGSRQAYQRRLERYCPNSDPNVFKPAHTHNGWLDTVLALGWIGAGLYLLVLLNFLRMGVAGLRAGGDGLEFALVLVGLSLFWILRGLTDSVYRDHQLEMQGFVLAYAAVALRLRSRPRPDADVPDGGVRA